MFAVYEKDKLRFLVTQEKQAEGLVSEIAEREGKNVFYKEYKRNLTKMKRSVIMKQRKKIQGESRMNEILEQLEDLNPVELNEFAEAFKGFMADKKDELKAEAKSNFDAAVGDVVLAKFKGEDVEVEVAKINEKTFTAIVKLEDGEVVKRPILFHNYLGFSKELEEEVEEDEPIEDAV